MMLPKNTLFPVAGLFLSLVTPAVADFYVYTGQENWHTPDGQVVAQSCWFFEGHPSCDDVNDPVSGTLHDSGGDLSGSGRGCICEGDGDACTVAPHEIDRFEIHVDDIGHYTIYSDDGEWPLMDTDDEPVGSCVAARDDDFQCEKFSSSHGGGMIFHCSSDEVGW